MDKREAKKLGAWISLLGGGSFVLAALTAAYIGFIMRPQTALDVLAWMGRAYHHSSELLNR